MTIDDLIRALEVAKDRAGKHGRVIIRVPGQKGYEYHRVCTTENSEDWTRSYREWVQKAPNVPGGRFVVLTVSDD